jgi:CRP-like cAMP-binding protein
VDSDLPESAGIMLAENDTLLRPIPGLLDSLTEEARRQLMAIGQPKVFEQDESIWQQGDPHEGIYLITKGRVRSFYIAPSGREVTLAYWLPGNFVGGPDIFGGGPHVWCSSAVQRCETIFLPAQALRKLALESAPIAVALLDALGFKGRCYSAMAQMLGTRSATERLERLLIFIATTYGIKDDDGIMVGASFNHADLAALIGSTRQWVTIQFARLQSRGVLRYNRGMILIRNLSALGNSD